MNPKEYKVVAVSSKPPKEWQSSYGPMLTYNLMLEGRKDPVETNKKPDSPKPKVGDVLYGHIEATEYGDKFKSDPRPSSNAPTYSPAKSSTYTRDDKAIQSQWAIGQAVSLFTNGKDEDIANIEKNANDFFAMIDRVKEGRTMVIEEEPLPEFPGEEETSQESEPPQEYLGF